MFTGIIEKCGIVNANESKSAGRRLSISADLGGLVPGDSIAVNGVCLTLLPTDNKILTFDLSPETLQVTTLNELKTGDRVNLERAMAASHRFGGHYVSGHVDATATLLERHRVGEYIEIVVGDFSMPAHQYILPKGSVTLDGVSLTINSVTYSQQLNSRQGASNQIKKALAPEQPGGVCTQYMTGDEGACTTPENSSEKSINGKIHMMLIPHTIAETNLGQLKVGQRVNVEFDYLTRVVAHQLAIMKGVII